MRVEKVALSVQHAKELAEELSTLSKLQSQALQTAAYMIMSRTDAEGNDQRVKRIGELCGMLGKLKLA